VGAVLLHEGLVLDDMVGDLGFVVVPIMETWEVPDKLRFVNPL
jgi:hypothetical protein